MRNTEVTPQTVERLDTDLPAAAGRAGELIPRLSVIGATLRGPGSAFGGVV
jgi:hypothetical protein